MRGRILVLLSFFVGTLQASATCSVQLDDVEQTLPPQEVSQRASLSVRGNLSCQKPTHLQIYLGKAPPYTLYVHGQANADLSLRALGAAYGSNIWLVDEYDTTGSLRTKSVSTIAHEILPKRLNTTSTAKLYATAKSFLARPGMRSACAPLLKAAAYIGDQDRSKIARQFLIASQIPSLDFFGTSGRCIGKALVAGNETWQCLRPGTETPEVDVVLVGHIPHDMKEIARTMMVAFQKRGTIILSISGSRRAPMATRSFFTGFITTRWTKWRQETFRKVEPWLYLPMNLPNIPSCQASENVISFVVPIAFSGSSTLALSLELLKAVVKEVSSLYGVKVKIVFVRQMIGDQAAEVLARQVLHVAAAAVEHTGGTAEIAADHSLVDWASADILLDILLLPVALDIRVLEALDKGKLVVSAGVSVEAARAAASGEFKYLLCMTKSYKVGDIITCLKSFFVARVCQKGTVPPAPSRELRRGSGSGLVRHWLTGVGCTSSSRRHKEDSPVMFRANGKLLPGPEWLEENSRHAQLQRGRALGPANSWQDAQRQFEAVAQQARVSNGAFSALRLALFRQKDPASTIETAASAMQDIAGLSGMTADAALARVLSCQSRLGHKAGYLDNLFVHQPLYTPLLVNFLRSTRAEHERVSKAAGGVGKACAIATDKHFGDSNGLIGRPMFRDTPTEWTAPVLNPTLDFAAIEQDYHKHAPGFTYFDDFLTEDAIQELLRFAQQTDMYFEEKVGYVGAYPQHGFLHPALIRLVEELRAAMPDLLKDYAVENIWSYKAMHSTPKALGIHADDADLNFNFWVTDTSANMDPDSGGLVVYQTVAPSNWTFEQYNNVFDQDAIREHLQKSGASRIVVPFRQGRCVLFNSSLFHESDAHHFRPGYKNLRINFTILFSRKERMFGRPEAESS